MVQPALAHIRPGDAGRVMLGRGDVTDQRHRLRVTTPRPHLGQPLTIADRLECPPVRQMHSHAINGNRPEATRLAALTARLSRVTGQLTVSGYLTPPQLHRELSPTASPQALPPRRRPAAV